MPKSIAYKWSVSVDDVDFEDGLARDVQFNSEHDRVDAGGFNAAGITEFLAGQTTQTVTVEFYGSYGAGEVHATIYPIHRDREIVPFAARPDMTTAVSATNPELRGNVQVLTYSPQATFGDIETISVEFTAADPDGLQFYETAAA
jgi:hypothetical protein